MNGNSTSHAIQSVSINERTVTLTLASAVAASDTMTVDYQARLGEELRDGSRNSVQSFANKPVRVVAAPQLQSAALATDGTALTLTFNESLDETSVPAATAFRVKVNGAPVALATTDPVSVAGRTVVLKLARPVGVGERVAVSYAKERAAPAEGGQ